MKAFIISDIHLEFYDSDTSIRKLAERILSYSNECEILIIPGDIGTIKAHHQIEVFFDIISPKFEKIICILGNHDFYYTNYDSASFLYNQSLLFKYKNITILDNNSIEINGKKIIGSTLFTKDYPDNLTRIYKHMLADFYAIHNWTVDKMFAANNKNIEYLTANINEGDIVITHHMPLNECVSAKFRGNELNRFFVCDIPELVKKASIWLYGHTHDYNNFKYENCELFCNPVGYPHEMKEIKKYIIEI